MIPITKNIIVVDERGNRYESTYKKRAKGLVNKGRARFINENTICIACPPDKFLEDFEMTENIVKADMPQEKSSASALTMDYVLSRIDQILNDNSHIHEAIKAVREMEVNDGMNNQDGDRARGEAIAKAVLSRETTNQQLLRMLEKMYDDLMPEKTKASDDMVKFEQLTDSLNKYPQELAVSIIRKAAQQMFVKPGAYVVN